MHDTDDNQRVTLLKEISHIRFPSLAHLNLSSNQIHSIEGLSRVRMNAI